MGVYVHQVRLFWLDLDPQILVVVQRPALPHLLASNWQMFLNSNGVGLMELFSVVGHQVSAGHSRVGGAFEPFGLFLLFSGFLDRS